MNKIIALTTLPTGWIAWYRQEDGTEEAHPVPALALCENGDIFALALDADGGVELIGSTEQSANFTKLADPEGVMYKKVRFIE